MPEWLFQHSVALYRCAERNVCMNVSRLIFSTELLQQRWYQHRHIRDDDIHCHRVGFRHILPSTKNPTIKMSSKMESQVHNTKNIFPEIFWMENQQQMARAADCKTVYIIIIIITVQCICCQQAYNCIKMLALTAKVKTFSIILQQAFSHYHYRRQQRHSGSASIYYHQWSQINSVTAVSYTHLTLPTNREV